MIIIEGRNVPTGEGVTVRPMTLDDCIEWRNDLVDVSDAEELLDILLDEIRRLHTKAERDRSASDADLAKGMPDAEAKKGPWESALGYPQRRRPCDQRVLGVVRLGS
jgi:hypothetical protein